MLFFVTLVPIVMLRQDIAISQQLRLLLLSKQLNLKLMFELIISILLSLGLSVNTTDSGKIQVNQDVIQQVQAQDSFNDLGGDGTLNAVVVVDIDPAR